jgi:hypothetical protein
LVARHYLDQQFREFLVSKWSVIPLNFIFIICFSPKISGTLFKFVFTLFFMESGAGLLRSRRFIIFVEYCAPATGT